MESSVKISILYDYDKNKEGKNVIDYELNINGILIWGCRVNNSNEKLTIPSDILDSVKLLIQAFEILNVDTKIELKMG